MFAFVPIATPVYHCRPSKPRNLSRPRISSAESNQLGALGGNRLVAGLLRLGSVGLIVWLLVHAVHANIAYIVETMSPTKRQH